jgi:hypothetical protein
MVIEILLSHLIGHGRNKKDRSPVSKLDSTTGVLRIKSYHGEAGGFNQSNFKKQIGLVAREHGQPFSAYGGVMI